MKKNKGFTLVELLAVVAILSILVIIALPNVMGMFNDAKEKSFMTECKQIYKVAQQTYINDSMFDQTEQIYARCSSGKCTKELDLSGRQELEYFVKFDKGGKIIEFYATDGTYQFGYNGGNLLITDIGETEEIEQISEIEETNKITISCTEGNTNKSFIAIYKYVGSEPGCHISQIEKTCQNGQTVKECLGNLVGSNVKYWASGATNNITISTNELAKPSSQGFYSNTNLICICLDGDSEIDVYDKKKKKRLKKKLRDITYDDLILCWDFDEGKTEWAQPLWIMNPQKLEKSIELTFSDGSNLKVVGDHRIYDVDKGLFVSSLKCEVGLKTFNSSGEVITLVDKNIIEEENYAYNVITYNHINMFANGILTSQGSNNIYDIKDMKFVKNDRDKFSEEDLSDIDSKYVEGLRLKEWNTLDKGSKEETLKDMHEYVNKLNSKRK